MSEARWLPLALGAALTAIIVPQAIVLWLAHGINTWTDVVLILVTSMTTLVGLGLAILAWHTDRRFYRTDPNPLARWIDRIDVTSDDEPRPVFDTNQRDAQLVAAAESLVLRTHRYRDKLLVRHQRVQRLLRNVTDVLYHVDATGRVTWVTDTVTEMLGYTPAELEGMPLRDLLADPDTDFSALAHSAQLRRHPTRVYRRDGSIAWLLVSSRRIDNTEGRPIGSEGVCRDGTRLIETQQELDKEKERAQVTLASIGDGVITTDAHGNIEYLNPRAQQMLGVENGKLTTPHFDTVCHFVDAESNVPVTGLVEECITAGAMREWENNLALGGQADHDFGGHAVKVTIAPIRTDNDHIIGAVIVLHDITRLQQISREMSYQANHDLLTGLPNRRAFEQLLAHYLGKARDEDSQHALCYLDLDQFKLVNDTCGHNAGDEMLRQITAQLSDRLRGDDTIARLGGDEFGIIMRDVSLKDAETKAQMLCTEIDGFRFHWQDKLFQLGASIGVAPIDRNAVSATELLRRADTACYLAKEKGRNQVYVYRGDSDETLTRDGDMQRMQQINDALDKERFALFAQLIRPLTPAPDTRLGVELLLRVRDANGDMLEPQNFLVTAERYNIASRIDRWVLRRALELISETDERFNPISHYSINVSGQSITDEQFVDFARNLIVSSDVDPRRLVFEITETAAVTSTQRAGELMKSLRALGCRFSLDDFGSGLSSFSYLKNLPSDFIKIDGKLVRRILKDPVERSIVEAINQVGQAMGLKTVAEHAESAALLDALERIGVDYVQGFHVARPVPFEQLPAILDAPAPLGSLPALAQEKNI